MKNQQLAAGSPPMATAQSTSNSLHGSTDAVWGFIRPFAVSLRDVMAHAVSLPSPMPLPEGAASASPAIPSAQSRRAACTHITMDRLYGSFECTVCHRPSRWGWLYACAQDDIEPAAGLRQQCDSNGAISDGKITVADLSRWIQDAIAHDQYSSEEVSVLVAQKQKVVDTIAAAEAQFKKPQRSEGYKIPWPSSAADVPSPSTDEAIALSGSRKRSLDRSTSLRSVIFPRCLFLACQLCRPTYRDRTWEVFQNIFASDRLPVELYDNYRGHPLSHRNIVQRLGLRKQQSATRPPLRRFDSSTFRSANRRSKSQTRSFSGDITDQAQHDSTNRFRDSMKRAFKGMLMTRRHSSQASRCSKRTFRKSRISVNDYDSAEFDMGLWMQLNEELLQQASNTPLPVDDGEEEIDWNSWVRTEEDGTNEDSDGKAGIKVTEEAVETGTVDIIMSA